MFNLILQHRRGTTEEWLSSTVVPKCGELLIEELHNAQPRLKIGDGVHLFADLVYIDENTVTELNNLLTRFNQHVAYIESGTTVPDSTLATEILDARTIDGTTYECLEDVLQTLSDKDIGGLVYDLKGEVGLHEPYYLYLTDKNGTLLENTGVQIISGSGGGGGGASSSTLKIERITPDPYIITIDENPEIKFKFSGTDSSEEEITQANATWKVDGIEVFRTFVKSGENNADYLGKYLTAGSHKVLLLVSDDSGTSVTKTWKVDVIDIRRTSEFDSTQRFDTKHEMTFTYTPYGAINKEVHFILDNEKLLPKTETTISGTEQGKRIPAQDHGSHYLEVYITADIEKVPGAPLETVESNHIFKDLIWYNFESADVPPVIGTDIHEFTCKEYDTTPIEYTVYSNSEKSNIVISVVDSEDNETVVATPEISSPTNTYNFRSNNEGTYTIRICCEDTVKEITAHVEKLNIPITPVTEGLVLDFNPIGKNNDFEDKLWTNGIVSMSVSDNFDWVNGGYQQDENGDPCFLVKAGTEAIFDYKELFSDTTKQSGREFKVIFKTANVQKRDTSIIRCLSETTGIGLDMRVENANIYSSVDHLFSPYCEEDIIEFEYNVSRSKDIPLILTYEDGVANRPLIYTDSSTLSQGSDAEPIKIGSKYCDIYIYRMKVYDRSLTDTDILSNFIQDARSSDEIAERYKRNQIYDSNTVLDPVVLAEKCPDLRIIMIEAPRFTYDKDDKVDGTTIRMIYNGGRKVEDNWVCTGAQHSGQGTSSNEYGYAGRNLDLIMNTATSKFTLSDGQEPQKITLTKDSVPVNYLNVKVNIASSENANNAQMATRYNKYNPFKRSAKLKDSKVKDCMEFYNCVVFIKETGPVSEHQEFKDDKWHFYAIGNVGDSKKTDNTRVNNSNDPRECVVEIADWNLPLSNFPTGVDGVCPIEEWNESNTAYQSLYAPYKYKDGKFKSFGNTTYEFRYEKKGITDAERDANIAAWRQFYEFIVTSDDEKFKQEFDNYFVLDSALYYYLFTERYTMVDNRAKNSFWHYGKVYFTPEEASDIPNLDSKYIDADKAAFNDGYRWDLTFGYDFDTSLGIDNVGKLTIPYGKEDIDYYDDNPEKGYIYRAADSTFFTRVRDLFRPQLESMYLDRESAGAWSSTDLIQQWDNSQKQFPEELWRLDIQRKYIRTYLGTSVDNSLEGEATSRFLTEMLNGRKRYQRRMFERNQELYMASKYFGNFATANNIYLRFDNPEQYNEEFKPDFSLEITPYADMYIGVSFANGSTPVHFRAKQGEKHTVRSPLSKGDITLVYGAKFIQAIGNLSRCYVYDVDFSKATRLQTLIIGDSDERYSNSKLTSLSLESNSILEYLDVSNLKSLEKVDVSKCFNLKTLIAKGCGCSSVEFARGGLIEKMYLPEITTLNIRKLHNIVEYDIPSTKLKELFIEDTPLIDSNAIVSAAVNLNRVRLIDIDWVLDTPHTLIRMIPLGGYDAEGNTQSKSVVTGYAHVNFATGSDYKDLVENYRELSLTFDSLESKVYFRDENSNVLDERTVYNPELAGTTVNPDGVTLKNIPDIVVTKTDLSGQYKYTHDGWTRIKYSSAQDEQVFKNILGDRDVYPRFISEVKTYNLRFYTLNKLIYEETLPYGTEIRYDPEKALKNTALIGNVIDEEGYPLKQDTGSPFMYKYVAFLPYADTITEDTELYADFVLSLDNVIPAVLTEFEYTQDDTKKTLYLNKYVAVAGDEAAESDSDSITSISDTYKVYDIQPPQDYKVVSIGGFNPQLEDVTVDVEIVELPKNYLEEIQDEAFLNCFKLLKAEIPSNVSYLGKKAFANCSALDEVFMDARNIKNKITSSLEAPFIGSASEKGFSLTITDNVTVIPAYMFYKANNEKSLIRLITWGNSPTCTDIKAYAFCNSTPTNMSIPDTVTSIEQYAFQGNMHHKNIDYEYKDEDYSFKMSKNIEHIGDRAFDSWSNLESIRLPNTISSIGGPFVSNCPKLSSIFIESGSYRYVVSDNCLVDTVNRSVIQGCNGSILHGGANGILEIGTRAFQGSGISTKDENLLPDSLIKIGDYAFSHCENITQISIPESLKTLSTQCFEYCSNLETIKLHDQVSQLGTYLFWNCTKLNNVKLPAALVSIPGGCFNLCSSLSNIEFSDSIKTIDMYAFSGTALKYVLLPDSVEHLGTKTFSNCKLLEEVTFGANIKRIGGSVVDVNVTEINPFDGCSNLKKINCPFSSEHELAQSAPWGVTTPVDVTYNYGSSDEITVRYN